MGNSSIKGPKTEKVVRDGLNTNLSFATCEMQGWRNNMEDAIISSLDFDKNSSLFGVLDGHGGPLISKFVANNFSKILTRMKSYKEKNYEQALIEAYLKFDELLRDERINEFLKEHNKSKDVIALDYKLDFEINTIKKNPILKDIDYYSTNPKSGIPSSEESLSKDILTFENSKIEVSFKTFSDKVKDDDLVALNMGTTANILLIRNNYLYLANVGDSLAVLFKNGEAIRLNQEHKTSLQSEYARINKSGARIINNRVEGRLNLTRAIGDLWFKNNKDLKYFDQAVTAYPEITKMKITKDMDFIVMGCDGVWDCVEVQKFCEHISFKLKSAKKKSELLSDLFDQIIAKTNNTPIGTDNMSCIIIQFIHDKDA